ncbi:hypothetical protein B9Z38_15035 [Limnohabitans sp. MMS-10A-160]|uniref:beta strand repeat-containing protein n=1 Tax=Limnohabitans sp. MMS-10A-160 TaxID=1835766 RepID=UPI000D384A6A|nr:Ig-like domain-containing protein [Limnohabitans sp. MMS-10A-160]PUE22823.1 hypothetical protein B9Z38_15035 [Limnohabitans sp. MMS-10A-160]
MAQQFKVLVNAGKSEEVQSLLAEQGAGQRGRPLIIKAKAGAKYQLVEMGKAKGNNTDLAPDNIKAKRVGKHLHLMFETDTVADVIIEDYYDVMAEGYNGVIGKAENGSYYEYLTEDPTDPGLIPQLKDNVTAVTQALGGAEVSPAGAAVAFAAFPLLGALGLLGGAAAVAAAANAGTTTTTGTTTGKLDATAPNDSGTLGDNKTNDNTPTLTGTVPTGSTATVTINGQTYPVTVNPNGTWSFTNPTNLPDGTYYPVLNVTTNGVTTPTNLTPFTIDTTPPTVAVVRNAAALAAGETANITFTLSEPSSDFALDDIAVSGGTLSNLTQSATDPKVYTATFTPSSSGTSATISVASDKFADAAANRNTDGAETNNSVSFKTNATATGALTATAPNDSGTLGDNLTNDNTPNLSGKVPAGSTATVTLNGKTYPATVDSTGKWTAQIPDTDKLPDGTYTPQLNVTTNGVTTTTPITPFTIDTVPATVAVTSNASTLASGQTTNVTFTLSEPVTDFTADDVQVTGGTLSNFQQSPTDPKVYTANTTASVSVASDKFADAAGNLNKDGADTNNTWSSTVTPASGNNSVKTALAIDPIAADNVLLASESGATTYTVTGKVTGTFAAGDVVYLKLNDTTYPAIVNADGTYSVPVRMSDLKADPDTKIEGSINPTGGDPATAAQDYTVESGNVATQTALSIDPVTADNIIGSTESTGNITLTGKVTGKFSAGDVVKLTVAGVTYSGTAAADGSYSIPVPAASLTADTDTIVDGTVTGTGGTVANAIQDYGVDAKVNPASVSLKTALAIDPIAADNVLLASESGATSYTVTGKVTGTFAAGDVVYLKLNGNTYPAIVKADGTYSTLVSMTDLKADSDTKIEGSINPTGGEPATAAQDYTVESGNVATQTALSIDPVTADNIIGSTESTGNITLTGKVTGKFSAGDIVKLTVAGVTYSGTAAADGSYSIPVPAAGLIADSDTIVDGTVTGTGGTVANAIQDYGVDPKVNPASASLKTALTIDPITGDNVVTLSESGATTYTVTGKVTGTFAAGDLVTLKINDHTWNATVNADGTYSTVIPMADIKADADTKIEGSVTGTGGQYATAAQDYTLEATNAVTQTALSIDPVTADNIIGSTESNGNITLTGKVTGKFSAGDIVKLTVAGVTYSGTAAADGSYSIPVPAAGLIADSDTQVDGTVTGTGGTVANAIQDYGVDPKINPASASLKTALTIDPITGDNVVTLSESGATTYTVTGKVTGTFAAGDLVTLKINDHTWNATVNADGTYSTVIPMADIKADADTKIEGSVTGTGGQYATAAQDYTLEATNAVTQTALSIDPVTADNIIGSTESNGNITLTGKVTGKFSAGDIVKLTVAGVTYSGTAAADGSYSIPVPAAGLIADSDTQVDGTVTGTGGTVAKAVQDYGVDPNINPAPASLKTALTIDPITGDNVVTLSESGAATYVVTGKVTGTFAAGDMVTLKINDHTWNATVNADGTYSTTIPMADIKADADTKIEGTVTGTGGSVATAAQDYTLEATNAVTQTALSIDPVTADNIIGSTESNGNITLTGKVTGKFSAGDIVKLTVAGVTYSGTAAADGSYSIPVPAAGLIADSDTQVDGTVTGTGGTVAKAVQDYGVDPNINPAPASLKTALTIDPITGDNVVTLSESGAATYVVTGKVTGTFAAGDMVTLKINDHTWNATVNADGTYSTTIPMADIKADADTKIEGSVTGGNGGQYATAAQDYTLEATNAVTQTALTIDPVTADNIIGSAESNGNIAITGKVTGKFAAGDIVTLTVKGITYSGTAAADGSYSIPVPAANLIADSDTAVDGTVTGTGGTVAKAVQDYGVDSTINPPPAAVADTNTVTEAGGTLNGTTFADPTGNVLTNDTAVGATKTVYDVITNTTPPTSKVLAAGVSNSITGTYGTLYIKTDGSYSYTPNNAAPAVEALNVGSAPLVETFTYTLKDSTGASAQTTLKINITGTDDAPVVSVKESNQTATIGTAFSYTVPTTTFSDVDDAVSTLTYSATLAGGAPLPSWLTFNPTTRTFSGTPPAGTPATKLTLAVTATDPGKLSATDTFTLDVSSNHASTVNPITPPPAIAELTDASAQNIAAINGTVTVNDVDTGNTLTATAAPATATWSGGTSLPTGVDVSALVAASALTFGPGVTPNGTASNITWTYDPAAANLDWLPIGQTITLTYPVSVSDGQGSSVSQPLVITITGTNDAPKATAINQQYNKGAAAATVGLLTNATDPDFGETATLTVDAASVTYTVTTNSSNGTAQAASATVPQGVTFDATTGTLRIDPSNPIFSTIAAGQNETIVATYKVKDVNGAWTTTTATLVVNGAGTNAVIASDDTALATEAGGTANGQGGATLGVNPSANLLTNDSNVVGTKAIQDVTGAGALMPVAATGTTTITGAYGSLVIAANGTYTYNVNNTNPTVEALRTSADKLTDTFSYTLTDGQGHTSTAKLSVTVQGANDAPVAVNDTASATEKGGVGNAIVGVDPTGNVLGNDTDIDSGDTKTVSLAQASFGGPVGIASGTTSATVSTPVTGVYGALKLGADGSYTYVVDNTNSTVQALKDANATVTDVFTYTVKDTAGLTSTATLTVTIHGANDAVTASVIASPAAIDELLAASAQDIAAINGTISVNDVDTGNAITASAGAAVASWTGGASLPSGVDVSKLTAASALTFGAAVTPNGAATNLGWIYDPQAANLDWLPKNQTLTLTYPVTISDGQGGTVVQPLVITIKGTNDAPLATPIYEIYNKGAAAATVGALSKATDPDFGETATLTVDPASITYAVTTTSSNGSAQAASATVPRGVTFDTTTGQIRIDPSDAIFSTIAAGENETIVVTYKVKDVNGEFVTTTATLVVNGSGSNAAVASDDTATAIEAGGTLNGTTGTNPSNNVLTNDTNAVGTKAVLDAKGAGAITPVAASGNTSITGAYGTLLLAADGTYTYNVNNTNPTVEALRTSTDKITDTFTYTLTDGQGHTSTAKLVVTVQGANDAPVAVNDTASATKAGGIGNATAGVNPSGYVLINDTDVDTGDTKVVSQVQGVGSALPVAASTTSTTGATTATGTYGSLKLGADGSYTYVVDPANATVQALKDFNATVTDTFTYTVKDAAGLTSTATLVVTVHGANDAVTASAISSPPAIVELTDASAQDIPATSGSISVNDPDSGNIITASAATATATWSGGSLPTGVNVSALVAASALQFGPGVTPNGTATNLGWTYDPQAANLDWLPVGQTLTITYPVTISDGQGGTVIQPLAITITGTNDAPTAVAIQKAYNKGAAAATVDLLSSATDPDLGEKATLVVDPNTPVTYVVTTNSSNGSAQASSTVVPAGVTLNANGTLTIDPSNPIFNNIFTGENETIVATYKIKDVNGAFVTTTATLIVNGLGAGLPIGSNDNNTATEAGGVGNGTVGVNPQGNVVTNDTTFTGVKLVKDATGAAGQTSVAATGTTNITGAFGTLVLAADGTYTYNVANSNPTVEALRTTSDKLTDTFTYTLTDGQGRTSTAQLIVTVQGANDAPVAVNDTASATEAGGVANATPPVNPAGNVLSNDTDIDTGDTKFVSQVVGTGAPVLIATGTSSTTVATPAAGAYGSLKLGADGTYTYIVDDSNATVQALKNFNETLTDTFTYTVKDAAGLTSTATLTVTVHGANDAPGVVGTSTAVTSATNMVPANFGTAFTFSDVDVGTGVMTLTLSSSDTDGKINVTPGSSGATVTAGNGTNSVTVSGTLAQLQALTGNASNFTFVNTASYNASHNVTITALLNDNGNQGNVAAPLTSSGTITFAVVPDPNAQALIDITTITTDSGVSATDYNTNDNTLVYSGTVTNFTANGARVKLELIKTKNADGTALGTPQVVDTTTVDPSLAGTSGTWTWNRTSTTETDGTYQLRATIVDANGNRVNPTSTVGSNTGTQDVQAIVIDTNTPDVDPNRVATIDIVTIDDGLSSTTAATGSKDTGSSATDFITSDRTLAYKGTITIANGWDTTQGDLVKLVLRDANNNIVATKFVTPVKTATGASWSWDDTGVTRDNNTTYTLEASIVDTAGNRVNQTAPVNGTNGGIDTQLITIDTSVVNTAVSFSSMTKDSGTIANTNANWTTSDSSAGRLVSGTLSAPLAAGETLKVFVGGVEIPAANIKVVGNAWEATDLNGYGTDASWTYTAQVVNSVSSGTLATQVVNSDYVAAPPVITAAYDAANASIADAGSTTKAITKLSGTSEPNAMVYLYDNTSTNLVGSAMADGSGAWTVTSLNITVPTNQFAAKQLDINGNLSGFSNIWDVNSSGNGLDNGNFSAGMTGYTTDITPIPTTLNVGYDKFEYIRGGNRIGVIDLVPNQGGMTIGALPGNWTKPTIGTLTQSATQNWSNGTWSENVYVASDANFVEQTAWGTFYSLASGKILGGSADGIVATDTGLPSSAANPGHCWAEQVSVVKGQTYQFSFNYWNTTSKNLVSSGFMDVVIDGQVAMTTKNSSAGTVTVNYVATKTGLIDLSLDTWSTSNSADFALDNMKFNQTSGATPDGSLQPGGTPPATPNPDALTYTGGAVDALGSGDTINVTGTDLQTLLNNGGYINGGSGMDTLKLAAGTTLNLDNLTRNQTVQKIQQVEVFQLQGSSSLTLTANDVLSLGGSNATTMQPYTFTSTSGGSASASSAGKVQFVVNGTSTDTVTLQTLVNDGVTTNGTLGNTGLAGTWADMGTTQIGGNVYRVYNHSTTQAQVLVAGANTVTPATTQSILINLENLLGDGVLTSGTEGNTGLAGTWANMGTVDIGGVTYKVYNHSTTEAQVLVANATVNTGPLAVTTTIGSAASDVGLVDSFTTSTDSGQVQTLSTALWNITSDHKMDWLPNPLASNWVFSGPSVLLNLNQTSASTTTATETFTAKNGVTFNAISFQAGYGAAAQNSLITVNFYDANNTLLSTKTFSFSALSMGSIYNFSHSFTGAATHFTMSTDGQNSFAIDNLGYTPVSGLSSISVASGGTVTDTTPVLMGAISRPLAVGETVEIFVDGSATAAGTATATVGSSDWTWTQPTALSAAVHTFVAKVKSGGSYVSTSSAFSLTVAATPLALDLNGDGVQTVSIDQGVQFDLLNTGAKQSVGWVDKHDGLLVMDLNGDGKINSGAELFGDRTKLADGSLAKDGWAALAGLDSNADGVIDAKDAAFNALNVWVDANGDGVTDAGELHTLKDLGIKAIGLSTTQQQVAQNGNILGDKGQFTTVDGQAHDVVDAWFKVDAAAAQTPAAAKSASVAASATAAALQAEATPVADAITGAVTAAAADQMVDVTLNELAPTGTEPVVLQPASALIQNKPYTLSPEQIAQFQAVVDAATAAAGDNAVDVTINELAPTGLEPLVFQHVLPINCEPSVMVPPAPVDAAVPTDATAVVDQQQPTHCDEPWLIELNGPTGTEPVVFNLNPASWNKPFALSAEQLSELGLPVPTDSNLANAFKLNVTDVLLTPADGVTPPALQINGAPVNGNTLNLSNLLGADAAPTQLTATGTEQQDGQAFTYHVDATLQAMIDQQHLQHATMS